MPKAVKLLLINLLIVLVAVVWILLTPEPEGATGTAHSTIDGMRVAVDGQSRFVSVFTPVLLMQFGTLGAIVSLILLPVWRGKNGGKAVLFLSVVLGLSFLVWLGIATTYNSYLSGEAMPYVFGFPLPSTFAVYAVWGIGLLLSLFYVFGFERFIYTNEDREAFEALLKDMSGTE